MASRVSQLPENLQLRILQLVADRPPPPVAPSSVGRGPPAAITAVPARVHQIADELVARGHATSDEFLSEAATRALYALSEQIIVAGRLRPARVGQSHAVRDDTRARADSIAWLPFAEHVELEPFASSLRELCSAASARIGEVLELPRSVMLARYPAHSDGYALHRDASELTAHRRVTAILYLNENWEAADGGELELHPDNTCGGLVTKISPEWNRLLLFRSELLHRVLPTRKPRLALTVWLQRAQPAPTAVPSAGQELQPAPGAASSESADLPTIFVSVPAYRDPEMQHTLYDLFAKAAHPSRVSVGLVWQGDTEAGADAHCFARPLPPEWAARCRTHWMHYREARGPTLARALAQRLWRGESHYLQVDSHSRFADGWDEALLDQLAQAEQDAASRANSSSAGSGGARVVLTTYPAWYERPDSRSPDDRPPLMCARAAGTDAFGADGFLRLRARTLQRRPERPVLSLFWAAGFAFSRAAVIREVPYDPDLPFLFFGEETAMAARLWTHGYDFYAPTTNLVYHLWDRSYRETFWQVTDSLAEKPRSIAHVQALLQGAPGPSAAQGPSAVEGPTFGLGRMRTLDQYEEWCGVSFGKRIASERAALGGQPSEAVFAEVASEGLRAALAELALCRPEHSAK